MKHWFCRMLTGLLNEDGCIIMGRWLVLLHDAGWILCRSYPEVIHGHYWAFWTVKAKGCWPRYSPTTPKGDSP